MTESREKGRVPKDHKMTHEKQVQMAKELKSRGKSDSSIAYIMRLPENIVRRWVQND